MSYDMSTPCDACPFRNDIDGYLRPERVREIAESLFRGQSFPCHKTTEAWEDDDGESGYYASTILGEELTREQVMERLDELLSLSLPAAAQPRGK